MNVNDYAVLDWSKDVIATNWKTYTNPAKEETFSKESISITKKLIESLTLKGHRNE